MDNETLGYILCGVLLFCVIVIAIIILYKTKR